MRHIFLILSLGALLLAGCDNPQKTIDSKRQAKIDEGFAKLESQIAALQQRGDPKADQLKSQLASLRSDYQAARMLKAVQDAKNAIQGFGDALKDTAKSVEDAFKKTNSDDQ